MCVRLTQGIYVCLTQLLPVLHPYVGDVFIAPGASGTVYALEG